MTIDEEIKHQEEISDRYARMSEYEGNNGNDGIAKDCAQCAADHRQLAEWLKELKELRNSVGAFKLTSMKDALNLISDLKQCLFNSGKDLKEAKRLLRLAVEELAYCPCENEGESPSSCKACINQSNCKSGDKFKWKHHDEAMQLLGKED